MLFFFFIAVPEGLAQGLNVEFKVTFVDGKANIPALFLNTPILHIILSTHIFCTYIPKLIIYTKSIISFYFFSQLTHKFLPTISSRLMGICMMRWAHIWISVLPGK